MMAMTEQGAADLGAAAIEREIAAWMKSYLADLLEIDLAEIDDARQFRSLWPRLAGLGRA